MYADNSAAIELASNPIYYFTKTLRPSIFELVQFERKMNLASLLKYEFRLQNNLADSQFQASYSVLVRDIKAVDYSLRGLTYFYKAYQTERQYFKRVLL